ncbi:hypothetical protein WMW72_09965 [Paenibacillus filicis]|uniref:ABC transporter ATP-binding protein n=1 Tax=Paenibacillus filicis TaxID=669464 RepID=A0ABU9DH77_9BACL
MDKEMGSPRCIQRFEGLYGYVRSYKPTVLLVTHDEQDARALGAYLLLLEGSPVRQARSFTAT